VTDTPIVSNPLNPKQLLLGSVDGNCPIPSVLGFHLSNDGGSTWKLKCMTSIITQGHVYWPSFDPSVGHTTSSTIGYSAHGGAIFPMCLKMPCWTRASPCMHSKIG
jgi:hypothetical protein